MGHTDAASVRRRLPAVAASISEMRALAVDFAATHCNATPELVSDIALCVSEAAANVVAHAYPTADGDITLTIHRDEDTLTIEVADEGVGTTATTTRPGLGIGTRIVETLSDATFDTLDGTGARVTMRFPCTTE